MLQLTPPAIGCFRAIVSRRCALAALAAVGGIPTRAASQAAAPPPTGQGFHFDGTVAFARPQLSRASERPFAGVGRFGAGPGLGLTFGYARPRFGTSASFEIGGARFSGPNSTSMNEGGTLAFVAAGHYRPAFALGAWRPVLTAGYVRQGFGGVRLLSSQIPADARRPMMLPDSGPALLLGRVSLLGNGARLGLGLERPLRAQFAVQAGATLDAVRFSKISYEAGDMAWPNAGWSTFPRIAATLRWYTRR